MTVTVDRRTRTSRSADSDELQAELDAARPATSGGRTGKDTDAAAKVLLVRLADLPADSPDRVRVRDRLIELYVPLAEYLARRFRNRGEQLDDLIQELGRSPTVADIAAHLGVSEEDVIEGLDSGHAYRALSLQAPVAGEEPTTELVDLIGDIDPDLENVEDREALRPLIARLPQREQRIIAMRFFGNMTQSQIASQLGISQMHVSRLLSHALGVLRDGLLNG